MYLENQSLNTWSQTDRINDIDTQYIYNYSLAVSRSSILRNQYVARYS